MDNNKYTLFYKVNKFSHWQSVRLELPVSEWENYAKEQRFFQYEVKDLSSYDAFDLHLLTRVVYLDGKYYIPEETIPYPDSTPVYIGKLQIDTELAEDYINDEDDFEEVYSKNSINWCWGYLWTSINTEFTVENKTYESLIVAQNFLFEYPYFIKEFKEKGFAVFTITEFSNIRWLAWLKDDKVRLIHQEYNQGGVETYFDVLLDKDSFFEMGENLLNIMQKYADEDMKRFQEYALKRGGKIDKDSIPYPKTEPQYLGTLDIKTNPETRDESDFEEFYKMQEDPWTAVYTYVQLGDKTEEVVLIAEEFSKEFPYFISQLKNVGNSVYDDSKFTETKLHAWLKGDKVRLFYQDYSDDAQEVIFDVMLDKDWFFDTAEKLINQMEELAISEAERYKEYLKTKQV